jgi:hypothetical protein
MELVVLVIYFIGVVIQGLLKAILKGVIDVLLLAVTVIGIGGRSILGWFRRRSSCIVVIIIVVIFIHGSLQMLGLRRRRLLLLLLLLYALCAEISVSLRQVFRWALHMHLICCSSRLLSGAVVWH